MNALRWEDVDLERGVVLIHRSFNRETGELKSTKSDVARRIPIEPELRPLLEAMHREARDRGSITTVRETDGKLSRQLRRCLKLAGVTRAELFAMNDPTRKGDDVPRPAGKGRHLVRGPRRRPGLRHPATRHDVRRLLPLGPRPIGHKR